jgi:hypothetical protein
MSSIFLINNKNVCSNYENTLHLFLFIVCFDRKAVCQFITVPLLWEESPCVCLEFCCISFFLSFWTIQMLYKKKKVCKSLPRKQLGKQKLN